MATRHDLSDEQWERIEGILGFPTSTKGNPRRNLRTMFNGIVWILRTGAPWRDLAKELGPWPTVYKYFREWTANGALQRVLEIFRVQLNSEGKLDWELWCIDGSNVRATRASGGASKKALAQFLESRKTMRWAAREADSGPKSTCSPTEGDMPSP